MSEPSSSLINTTKNVSITFQRSENVFGIRDSDWKRIKRKLNTEITKSNTGFYELSLFFWGLLVSGLYSYISLLCSNTANIPNWLHLVHLASIIISLILGIVFWKLKSKFNKEKLDKLKELQEDMEDIENSFMNTSSEE